MQRNNNFTTNYGTFASPDQDNPPLNFLEEGRRHPDSSESAPLLGTSASAPSLPPMSSEIPRAIVVTAFFIALCYSLDEADMVSSAGKKQSAYITYLAAALSLLNALLFYMKPTRHGLHETYQTLRQRKLPADWHTLSRAREGMSVAAFATIGVSAAAAAGVTSYYFAKNLPIDYQFNVETSGWTALCITLGSLKCIGSLLSEGLQTYRTTRALVSPQQIKEYTTPTSRLISPALGYTVGVMDGMGAATNSFVSLTSLLNRPSLGARIGFACFSLVPGTTDFFLVGTTARDTLDDLIAYRRDEGGFNKREIVSAFIVAGLGGFMATQYYLVTQSNAETAFELFALRNPAITVPIITTLSAASAAGNMVTFWMGSFPHINRLTHLAANATEKLYQRVSRHCWRNDDPQLAEDPVVPVESSIIDIAAPSPHSGHIATASDESFSLSEEEVTQGSLSVNISPASSIHSRADSPLLFTPIAAPREIVRPASTPPLPTQNLDDHSSNLLRRHSQ